MGLWSIKELSQYLKIKTSTLYAWAAKGKIPCVKIHRLIRFRPEEIDAWMESFRQKQPQTPSLTFPDKVNGDIDRLIARAKQEVYNSHRGETRPISGPRKGVK